MDNATAFIAFLIGEAHFVTNIVGATLRCGSRIVGRLSCAVFFVFGILFFLGCGFILFVLHLQVVVGHLLKTIHNTLRKGDGLAFLFYHSTECARLSILLNSHVLHLTFVVDDSERFALSERQFAVHCVHTCLVFGIGTLVEFVKDFACAARVYVANNVGHVYHARLAVYIGDSEILVTLGGVYASVVGKN